jgi:exodeoxyribonuclease VII large subunit
MNLPTLTPSEFVALVNQTFDLTFPVAEIEGEVTNFKISKNRWVYFDIQDDYSKIRCFGTVYLLPGPVEDGMMVMIVASPKLHQQFGFSCNIQSLQFSGEGVIKKASDLLRQKLEKEGLFLEERKRAVMYPPNRIGLIASGESAAYKDFTKVLSARYGGIQIDHIDVAVQGESAVPQVVKAVDWFNKQSDLCDVLVITRGGGSSDDLQAFSSEQVTRAVAASRIPTVVAIGHEIDVSLAELAADLRASTPSNAAELLVPDRKNLITELSRLNKQLSKITENSVQKMQDELKEINNKIQTKIEDKYLAIDNDLTETRRTLEALSPKTTLKRGYSIVRNNGKVVKTNKQVNSGDDILITLADDSINAKVQ